MLHEPRYYQEEAYQATRDYWNNGGDHPLVVLATGTGKSLVQAMMGERLIGEFTDFRILCATDRQELIEQNYLELLGEWPFAPAGIYSAGLGRRDSQARILFCGIQSVYNKAKQIGWVDLLMVDEAHGISKDTGTRYAVFIAALLAINPEMRIVGYTATDYRTDSGRLTEGDERLFTDVVYEYGISDGIRDGYLTPLVSKATVTGFDMTGVKKSMGDFAKGAMQTAVDKTETTRSAVEEIVAAGSNRRSWLAFCAGVEHAEHVRDEIRSHGITCEMITGDKKVTPAHLRRKYIEDFKTGKIRCLTNNSVLTTGFNAPGIDLIAGLRPTLSPGLLVQMAGRGTRNVYAKGMPLDTVEQRLAAIAAGPKPNCLYMDFAGNIMRHGPIDAITPRKPGEGTGEAPIRECPNCRSLVHISARVCPDCGFEFPENEKPKHSATSAAIPILSNEQPKWLNVQSRKMYYHENAEGSESVRVDFLANFNSYKLWLSVKKAKGRCDKFWRDHVGRTPYPEDVEEWLSRVGELRETAQIQVRPKGKFWEIVGIKPAEQHAVPGKITNIQEIALENIPF